MNKTRQLLKPIKSLIVVGSTFMLSFGIVLVVDVLGSKSEYVSSYLSKLF